MKVNKIVSNFKDEFPQLLAETNANDLDCLITDLNQYKTQLRAILIEKGMVLIRGYDLTTPQDFQKAALTIFPKLQAEYPGAGPRTKVTEYVWTVSETDNYLPIPGHTELSYFPADRPDYILFFCSQTAIDGGETPVIDMKSVLLELRSVLPQKYFQKNLLAQILMVKKAFSLFDVRTWKIPWFRSAKSWSTTFKTEDKNLVKQIFKDSERELEWTAHEDLIVSSVMTTTIHHPITNELLWSGLFPKFHLWGISIESWFILKYQKNLRAFSVFLMLFLLTLIQTIFKFLLSKTETIFNQIIDWFNSSTDLIKKRKTQLTKFKFPSWIPGKQELLNVFLEDRSSLSICTVYKIIKSYWKNAKIIKLQPGDILILDNYRMGHGRLPYKGNRQMYTIIPARADEYHITLG